MIVLRQLSSRTESVSAAASWYLAGPGKEHGKQGGTP